MSSSLRSVCNPVDSAGSPGDFSRVPGDFEQFEGFAIADTGTPCQTHTQPNHLLCSLPREEGPAGNAEGRATGSKRLRRRRAEGSARIGSAGTWKQDPVADPSAARQAGLLRTEPEPPEAAAIGRDRGGSEEADHLCGVVRPRGDDSNGGPEKPTGESREATRGLSLSEAFAGPPPVRAQAPRSRPAKAGKPLGASAFQRLSQARRRSERKPREADRRKPRSRWGPQPFRGFRRPASSTRPRRSDTAGTPRRVQLDPPRQAQRAVRRPARSPCAPPGRRQARRPAGAG